MIGMSFEPGRIKEDLIGRHFSISPPAVAFQQPVLGGKAPRRFPASEPRRVRTALRNARWLSCLVEKPHAIRERTDSTNEPAMIFGLATAMPIPRTGNDTRRKQSPEAHFAAAGLCCLLFETLISFMVRVPFALPLPNF